MKDKKDGCKHRWIRREEIRYVIRMKRDGWPSNLVGLRSFVIEPLTCEVCGVIPDKKAAKAIMKELTEWKKEVKR